MLLGAREVWFADTAFPAGPLLAPIWVRFFVRRRAIVETLCFNVGWGELNSKAEIFLEGNFCAANQRSEFDKR
jgi:hypothetical protein